MKSSGALVALAAALSLGAVVPQTTTVSEGGSIGWSGTVEADAEADGQPVSIGWDYDGDGIVDAVVCGTGGTSCGATCAIELFEPTPLVPSPINEAYRTLIVDLDADGDGDLVTSAVVSDQPQTTVRRSNGDRTFQAPVVLPLSGNGWVPGDLDGDGALDLVGYGRSASDQDQLRILYGDGDGGFPRQATAPFSNFASPLHLGDLDEDGDLDAVVVVNIFVRTLRLLRNDAGVLVEVGTVDARVTPWETELGDLDGDGYLDLVTAGDATGAPTLSVRRGNGDLTFDPAVTYAVTTDGRAVDLIADVDGDDDLDVVADRTLFRNDGTGDLSTQVDTQARGLPADVDGDGVRDLVTPSTIYLADGTGTFVAHVRGGRRRARRGRHRRRRPHRHRRDDQQRLHGARAHLPRSRRELAVPRDRRAAVPR
jgi:hypothetical protein